ncbi:hypothetical protein LPB41_02645 [Thalassospira sp. MA62]|nr:hypothetical protein [Thalassospira sp. MA62]
MKSVILIIRIMILMVFAAASLSVGSGAMARGTGPMPHHGQGIDLAMAQMMADCDSCTHQAPATAANCDNHCVLTVFYGMSRSDFVMHVGQGTAVLPVSDRVSGLTHIPDTAPPRRFS